MPCWEIQFCNEIRSPIQLRVPHSHKQTWRPHSYWINLIWANIKLLLYHINLPDGLSFRWYKIYDTTLISEERLRKGIKISTFVFHEKFSQHKLFFIVILYWLVTMIVNCQIATITKIKMILHPPSYFKRQVKQSSGLYLYENNSIRTARKTKNKPQNNMTLTAIVMIITNSCLKKARLVGGVNCTVLQNSLTVLLNWKMHILWASDLHLKTFPNYYGYRFCLCHA